MKLVKWEPFKDLARLEFGIDRWFDPGLFPTVWNPSVDVYETDNDIVLKAELPGIDQNLIDVQVDNHTLSLRGERKVENETKKENYRRVERSYGSFSRTFTLPETVEQEKIRAEYKDGVLTITLPKRPETKPKQIKVA